MSMRSKAIFAAMMIATTALTACKSSEERAEEYYQEGLALLEEGDVARATIQLRNVFELNGRHREARIALAEIFMDEGAKRRAYAQYLLLAEQYPDDVDTRIKLSQIAFSVRDWEEFERHALALERIGSDSPEAEAIALGLEYRNGVANSAPAETLDDIGQRATALSAELPSDPVLLSIIIDGNLRRQEYSVAIDFLQTMIDNDPTNRDLYDRRLAVLAQVNDEGGVEAQLRTMVERFPDDIEVKSTLIRFYVARGNLDAAEAFLRDISDPSDADPTMFLELVRFVSEVRGEDAARAEIQKAIEVNPTPLPFQAMLSGLDFQRGETAKAIADLEALLAASEPSPEARRARVTLAKMLLTDGNDVGARAQVEQVLTEDPGNAEALKMQAAWQIEADDTDGAIASLRGALDSNADDTDAMSLMAEAYSRAGSMDLARDFLALAADASGYAPAESIRYARVLMNEGRYLPAEDVLVPALRLAPNNLDLLGTLGELYVLMDDSARATQVIATIRRLDGPEAQSTANALEASAISRNAGPEEAISFLENLAQGESADLGSQLLLVRARLDAGDTAGAASLMEQLVSENPDNDQLAALRGSVLQANGDFEEAQSIYQSILDRIPTSGSIWLQLSRLKLAQGDREAATAVVDQALAELPEDANLLWAKATFLEQEGDIDGAIAIYENLYERLSGSIIVANNLASTLSTFRDDPESLERAYLIARRLVNSDQPPLQDTYGWIAHRRGNSEEALPYLESAAAGLPGDPIVQYHLGAVYAALGRNEEAITQFRKAIDIAGPGDTRPQIELAKTEIERLSAAPNE